MAILASFWQLDPLSRWLLGFAAGALAVLAVHGLWHGLALLAQAAAWCASRAFRALDRTLVRAVEAWERRQRP